MKKIGLFVIPIKFNNKINTYNDYIDFLVEAEKNNYTHVYIGEHLTDKREDIQSSMIFAAALLSRTKKINACLSVLPLPHYDIKLLVKQLEDLEKMSNGRLNIGFSQGALKSDAEFLGFDHSRRNEIFKDKLNQFFQLIEESPILKKLPKESFFSTLLSPLPVRSAELFNKGYSAITSNFVNKTFWKNHIGCLTNNKNILKTNSKWHICMNLMPKNDLDSESYFFVKESLFYIYEKLNNCKLNVMFPNYQFEKEDPIKIKDLLFKENVFEKVPKEFVQFKNNYPQFFGHPIINVFDCIKDSSYCEFIYKLPSDGMFS